MPSININLFSPKALLFSNSGNTVRTTMSIGKKGRHKKADKVGMNNIKLNGRYVFSYFSHDMPYIIAI